MPISRQTRTQQNTQYKGRKNLFSFFLEYLAGLAYNGGDPFEHMLDHNNEQIIINSDTGFYEIKAPTPYTERTRPL